MSKMYKEGDSLPDGRIMKSAKPCRKCGGYYPGDCSCGIDCGCDGCNTIREMEKNNFTGHRGWNRTYFAWLGRNKNKKVRENLEIKEGK